MKGGAENRKKTIAAGALGAGALVCLFIIYNTLFAGPDAPAPNASAPAPVRAAVPTNGTGNAGPGNAGAGNSRAQAQTAAVPGGAAPGVQAQKLASANSSLDPTLDRVAMLRTESLVYSGTGRNIFSAVYTPPPAAFKAPPAPPARPLPPVVPVNTGPPPPPPPPPIALKFFGTATRANGSRQAFLLSGDDVYLASQGDIVARKYKIESIRPNSISVTDLTNNNTQSLPLQTN